MDGELVAYNAALILMCFVILAAIAMDALLAWVSRR